MRRLKKILAALLLLIALPFFYFSVLVAKLADILTCVASRIANFIAKIND